MTTRLRRLAVGLVVLTPLLLGVDRPIGCGGTPRLLQVDGTDGSLSPNFAVVGRTRTISDVILDNAGPYTPFTTVRWRGDPNSYVDVFDVPILTTDVDGAPFANVVRLPYPRTATSDFVAEFVPATIFNSTPLPPQVPAWRGSTTMRMYDRGECSGSASWRELGDGLATGFDRVLNEMEGAPPRSNWIMSYELRQEFMGDRDEFAWTRAYEFTGLFGFTGVFRLTVRGRFVATGGELTYQLLEVQLRDIADNPEPVPPEVSALIEPAIARGVLETLAQPLQDEDDMGPPLPDTGCTPDEDGVGDLRCFQRFGSLLEAEAGAPDGSAQPHNLRCVPVPSDMNEPGGECRFVPNVYRVNHRVDGIEVVLSEEDRGFTGADPLIRLLERAGACHGFAIGPTTPSVCVHDALPEVHDMSVPLCGDMVLDIPE